MSDHPTIDDYDHYDNYQDYQAPNKIHQQAIFEALISLALFKNNLDFNNQAMNLTIVDKFIMELEYDYLHRKFDETSSHRQSIFLSAQSQMWIFAAYELMRTWREKSQNTLKRQTTLDWEICWQR